MKRINQVVLTCLLALLTGCATIINSPSERISFSSMPDGAKLYIDGHHQGSTPMALDLKRRKPHTVRMSLDGYQDYRDTVSRVADGWVFANILLGGLIGIGIDLATGSCYGLDPDHIHCEFVPLEAAAGTVLIEAAGP